MKYRRVTHEDRLQLKAYLDSGLNQSEIGDKLKFNKSTISREIVRNSGKKGYRSKQSRRKADARQIYRLRARKMTDEITGRISMLLAKKWSPEQISERLKHEKMPSVSTETIYKYIYANRKAGGMLYKNLRRSHKSRKHRLSWADRRGRIQNACSIEQRPAGANNRSRYGHWERDTMLGRIRKTALLVCVERKARYTRLAKLLSRVAETVTSQTARLLDGFTCKSITNDRGMEFYDHVTLAEEMNTNIFFCHPYSSQERGTNENMIGLIRQYFPKGSDISNVTYEELMKVETELNLRPMKTLAWKTPYEVLLRKKVALTT